MIHDEVLTAVQRRAEALSSGDPDRLCRWLHEDFVWTSHRREVFRRAAGLPHCFRTPDYWVSGYCWGVVVLVQDFLWGSVPQR